MQNRQNFQSHYGLILSKYIVYNNIANQLLSIPLWSDFIFEIFEEDGNTIVFQSHYGLILSMP